jgi:hypothetical protein
MLVMPDSGKPYIEQYRQIQVSQSFNETIKAILELEKKKKQIYLRKEIVKCE